VFFKFHLGKFCTDSKKDIPKHICCEENCSNSNVKLYTPFFKQILNHKIKFTFSKLWKVYTLNMWSVGAAWHPYCASMWRNSWVSYLSGCSASLRNVKYVVAEEGRKSAGIAASTSPAPFHEATCSYQRQRQTSRPPFCGSRNPNERIGDDRVKCRPPWRRGVRRRAARFFFLLP